MNFRWFTLFANSAPRVQNFTDVCIVPYADSISISLVRFLAACVEIRSRTLTTEATNFLSAQSSIQIVIVFQQVYCDG
jgi:hypothetical protein